MQDRQRTIADRQRRRVGVGGVVEQLAALWPLQREFVAGKLAGQLLMQQLHGKPEGGEWSLLLQRQETQAGGMFLILQLRIPGQAEQADPFSPEFEGRGQIRGTAHPVLQQDQQLLNGPDLIAQRQLLYRMVGLQLLAGIGRRGVRAHRHSVGSGSGIWPWISASLRALGHCLSRYSRRRASPWPPTCCCQTSCSGPRPRRARAPLPAWCSLRRRATSVERPV